MRKFFALSLITICIMGQESAKAGIIECFRQMINEPITDTPLAKGYQDYDRFLKMRRVNPSIIPPAKPVTKETTLEEKFFAFEYWWIPSNVWHVAMTSQYSGMHMLKEFKRSGGRVPPIEEMPEVASNDYSLNVPQVLPELPPGKLSPRFKRQQRREFQNYLSAREKDQHVLPPVTMATEDTAPEEIYFGFRFWWFPHNIWHDEVANHHDEFAKRMLETHIRDGFVFPDPPRFQRDEEFDLPGHLHPLLDQRSPMETSLMLGISQEAASLDHAAQEIDGFDSTNPNSASTAPSGTTPSGTSGTD